MTTERVSVHRVDVDHVMRFINSGYGKLLFSWTDRVWHHWRMLGWDYRTDRDTEPPDVDAYTLTPDEARLLGVIPQDDDSRCVLFIVYEVQTESVPIRAAVVGEICPSVCPEVKPVADEIVADDV